MLFIASFSAPLELISMEFNVTQYVDLFDLFHIFLDVENDAKLFTFEHTQNEMKPSNVEKKMTNLIKWGIPSSKLVNEICFLTK